MSRKRARSNAKKKRRENAIAAQQHLSEVIVDISMPMIARMNAAKHLVRTSSKKSPTSANISASLDLSWLQNFAYPRRYIKS